MSCLFFFLPLLLSWDNDLPEEDGVALDDDDDDSFVVQKMDSLFDWGCRTVCCLRETDPPNA